MDAFNTIRLKKKTLDKFKKYSKKISPSYSETLDFMMAFFEDNNLSPYDTLRMSDTSSLLNVFNKRIDAVVSVFRNVEQKQLKPTKKLLESLFEEMETIQNPLDEEPEFIESTLITKNEEQNYYHDAYYKQHTEFNKLKYELKNTFGKLKLVKNTFSADQYVLKLSEREYQALKDSLA